jgi:uncharacterized protein (TIGR03067 family)
MVALVTAGASDVQKLQGTWVGTNDGEAITLTFGPKNMIKIRVGTDTGEGTYSVDWSETPAHLDIDWGKLGKVKTIVELKENTLRLENVDPGEERPKKFTGRATSLKRDIGK